MTPLKINGYRVHSANVLVNVTFFFFLKVGEAHYLKELELNIETLSMLFWPDY